jgi:hypothetical protein
VQWRDARDGIEICYEMRTGWEWMCGERRWVGGEPRTGIECASCGVVWRGDVILLCLKELEDGRVEGSLVWGSALGP